MFPMCFFVGNQDISISTAMVFSKAGCPPEVRAAGILLPRFFRGETPSCLSFGKDLLKWFFCSNYSDLTRPHPKWWFSKGNPLISGKSRLVKYYNLARFLGGYTPPFKKTLGALRTQTGTFVSFVGWNHGTGVLGSSWNICWNILGNL